MAAAKCASLAARGRGLERRVTLMSRNGTDMGLQLAGLPGRWFARAGGAGAGRAAARAAIPPADAALDIGDSAVIECIGLGGMALAAAPAVAAFFGGGAADGRSRGRELMAEICAARSERFTITARDYAGTPVGIDARLVVELGVDAADHAPACCTHRRRRARSARASHTSRSRRSSRRRWRWSRSSDAA